MGRVVVLTIPVLIFIGVIGVIIADVATKGASRIGLRRARWRIRKRSSASGLYVQLVKRGELPITIDRIEVNDPNFGEKLAMAQVTAEDRMAWLERER